ncbi:Dabb family protein [Williamsia sp. D3]|uniref:Dabb family protein n=1 Tax=Williamsia sp. D3 TaxID=1313067 RepID=UPI0003D32B07|nr:Dabb family protein [Williamsia sp. D3]ETD33276.1 stress protein [Williamsia sp. D3]
MSFTHVVTFKWDEQGVDESAVTTTLMTLVRSLTGVDFYQCGPDADLAQGNWDYAVIGVFATRDDFIAYRDHPEHRRILADLIVPYLADKTVVQIAT